jgi:hypothetical protein
MLEASYSASRSFGRHDGNPPGLIVPLGNLRNSGDAVSEEATSWVVRLERR